MSNRTSPVLQFITIAATFSILTALFIISYLITPVSFDKKWKEVEIPEGSSYSKGLAILVENEILKNRLPLLILGRIVHADRYLKPGFYHLSASMSPLQIFDTLIDGRTIQFSITIPEGATLEEIRKRFDGTGLISDEAWSLVYDSDFLDSVDVYAPSLEGYIFPDTYNFPKGMRPRNIFRIMVQRLREVFDETLLDRAAELGMTENEVLTLASIIEKEAIYDSERPKISSVYHNRLMKNMKLQADPTVLYGIKDRSKRIRYRDLKRVTPYNTYVIKGLPPGPIASPGLKSIRAALYPEDADYLFFVSMNNGRHYFSRTGEEHVKAIAQYQLNGNDSSEQVEKEIN